MHSTLSTGRAPGRVGTPCPSLALPPPLQDANTRSFKMLHEYLEAARTGSRVPVPYRFHFFIRDEQAGSGGSSSGNSDGSSDGSNSGSSDGSSDATTPAEVGAQAAGAHGAPGLPLGLREVAVTLPPPTRGAPGEALSGSARKAFGTLLAALGLPGRIAVGDAGQAADEFSRFVSLRDFLPRAVEEVHQHAAAQVGVGSVGGLEGGGMGCGVRVG